MTASHPHTQSELSMKDCVQPALHTSQPSYSFWTRVVEHLYTKGKYNMMRDVTFQRVLVTVSKSDLNPGKTLCPFTIQNEPSSHQTSMLNKQKFPLTCTSVHLFLKSSVTLL